MVTISQHIHLRGSEGDSPRPYVWCEANHARPNYSAAVVAYVGAENIDEDGSLPRVQFGSEGDTYFLDGDGMVICSACASKAVEPFDDGSYLSQDRIIAAGTNYEDPSLYCDDCGERIESGYAEE